MSLLLVGLVTKVLVIITWEWLATNSLPHWSTVCEVLAGLVAGVLWCGSGVGRELAMLVKDPLDILLVESC